MIHTDGGLSASRFADVEDRDCTVRALAIACEMSYEDAHDFMKMAGRRDKRGVTTDRIWPRLFGCRACCRSGTVAKFIKRHPKGRYLINISRHAFAIVDGEIHDLPSWNEGRLLRSKIDRAYDTTDIILAIEEI